MVQPPTRVLIVDDSAVVRKLIADGLRGEPGVEIIGGAENPFVAIKMIVRQAPDLLTLDLEMPRMDGLTFLSKIMAHDPIPTIIVSALTPTGSAAAMEALRLGAIDVIAKPSGPRSIAKVIARLRRRIRLFRASPPPKLVAQPELAKSDPWFTRLQAAADPAVGVPAIMAIGASTGGPQAIESMLSRLPAGLPPIVIAQHLPAGFSALFAKRLAASQPMPVFEAGDGQLLESGTAYVAPSGVHLTVVGGAGRLRARLEHGVPVNHQRPSVDVLFRSLARFTKLPRVAMLLTGMGNDGAGGLAALRASGAVTIAEAASSCVVFGMPAAAIALDAAMYVTPLLMIPALAVGSLRWQITGRGQPGQKVACPEQ